MQDYKCIGGHKVDGKIPTVNDIQFSGRICDCGRFVVEVKSCNCGGTSKKVILKPNTHYAASK